MADDIVTPVSASTVRISHLWYDGPQVALEVSQNGAWVPYGDSDIAADIDAWVDRVGHEGFLDTRDWRIGLYRFVNGSLTFIGEGGFTLDSYDEPEEARRG